MSRKRNKKSDSHPFNFSAIDLREMAMSNTRWLDHNHPLDTISIEAVQQAMNEALRGAHARIQWLWEHLEPADAILATCVDRRLGALKKIPWDIRKKDGLTDAEDLLAEAQLRTMQDLCNSIGNLDEGIAALAQASFRSYRHLQLFEDESGNLKLNITDNWNWCRDGYNGQWQWNPSATFGLTRTPGLPVAWESIITRYCARPIDQPAMMLALDRKNAKAQWLVYAGRYGTPPVFAIMPAGISDDIKKTYLDFARQLISNAAGVLPAGADVKTVQPGTGGPDVFLRLIEMANQELVLRATGGLMTMLTAPGEGTNTSTGNAHQDAFDDLAAAEAEEIAAVLTAGIINPALEQWHPGQPHLVELVMKRPDSDNAAGSVQTISTLASAGYRTEDEQVRELTGLNVYTAEQQPMATPMQQFPALNSLHKRYAPTMRYAPSRAVFDTACRRAALRLQARNSAEASQSASRPAADDKLDREELAAMAKLAASGLNNEAIREEALVMEDAMRRAVSDTAKT